MARIESTGEFEDEVDDAVLVAGGSAAGTAGPGTPDETAARLRPTELPLDDRPPEESDPAGPRRRRWLVPGIVAAVLVVAVVAAVGAAALSPVRASITGPSLPPAAPAADPAGLVLLGHGMPNPSVLTTPSTDYLYTGGYGTDATPRVPVRTFTTLDHLGPRTDAMPDAPPGSWGWVWTVAVTKATHGYAMWFTTEYPAIKNPSGVPDQCIGVATARSPEGPFTPSMGPVICQTWGSIDPEVTTGPGGQKYLVWKADTNADHTQLIPTAIWEQKLADDGTTLEGQPHVIATSTQAWEGGLAEAPSLLQLGGHWWLFFSGNASVSPSNSIGLMPCAGVEGPCTDSRPTPFLTSNAQGTGPGELSTFQQDGETWLLYSPNAIFGANLYRPLAVARIVAGPQGPYVATFDGVPPGRRSAG